MDALDQLTNMYASSAGSAGFNQRPDPTISGFGDHEGGDILKVYSGQEDNLNFGGGYNRSMGMYDDSSNNPVFGIDRQRDNYQRANNFINNDLPRPYTGGYNPRQQNENYEDILDSLKDDGYDHNQNDSGYFGNASNRGYTAPENRRGYNDMDRRGVGTISVDNRSIPDLDRSRASSRDDDLRSIQPQNLASRGQTSSSANKPNWLNSKRGVSTSENRRRDNQPHQESPGGIDVIETPNSRRHIRTAENRNKGTDERVPRFGDVFKERDRPMSKPPLYNKPSIMEEEERVSQYRDGPRSGRFRQDDDTVSGYAHSAVSGDIGSRRRRNEDDNISDYGSRRRADDKDRSINTNEAVPALETSVSRRSNRFLGSKTPGFKNDRSHEEKSRKDTSGGFRGTGDSRPFEAKADDLNSFAGSPKKERAWGKANENKRVESLSPTQKANQDRILKIYEDIKLEENRRKQIEDDYREQIKQMRERHENSMSKMQPPKNIEEERKDLIKNLTKKLDREIERIQKQHEANLEIEEAQHKANLERERLLAEQHSDTLKRQLEQQIQISDLVKEVQSSSTKLETIMKANMEVSENTLRNFQKKVLELESEVNHNLTNLVIKQRTYNDLVKKVETAKKDYDLLNDGRLKQEKNKLIEEATLKKLQVENSKTKQKRIEQMLEQELIQKENELEQEKERLNREKRDADDQQREYEKKIQLKYLEIDERKKNLVENETYLLKKVQGLDHKDETVRRESEALRYKMEQLDDERIKFEDKAYQAQQTSIKVFEESEFVSVHKKEYEDDRAELEKLRYELEAEKAHVRAEHLKLEQKRTEILMRERMLDQLKLNRVQDDLDMHQRIYQSAAKPSYVSEPFSMRNSKINFYNSYHDIENNSPSRYDIQSSAVKNTFIKSNIPKSPIIENKPQVDSEAKQMYEKLSQKVTKSEKSEHFDTGRIQSRITFEEDKSETDLQKSDASQFRKGSDQKNLFYAKNEKSSLSSKRLGEGGLDKPKIISDLSRPQVLDVKIEDNTQQDDFDFNEYDDGEDDYTEDDYEN